MEIAIYYILLGNYAAANSLLRDLWRIGT